MGKWGYNPTFFFLGFRCFRLYKPPPTKNSSSLSPSPLTAWNLFHLFHLRMRVQLQHAQGEMHAPQWFIYTLRIQIPSLRMDGLNPIPRIVGEIHLLEHTWILIGIYFLHFWVVFFYKLPAVQLWSIAFRWAFFESIHGALVYLPRWKSEKSTMHVN